MAFLFGLLALAAAAALWAEEYVFSGMALGAVGTVVVGFAVPITVRPNDNHRRGRRISSLTEESIAQLNEFRAWHNANRPATPPSQDNPMERTTE